MKDSGIETKGIDNINLNEKTIWNIKENQPELVVQDCIREFQLNELQAEKLRTILLIRGVNKWLYARIKFIKLKHKVKHMLNEEKKMGEGKDKEKMKILQFMNIEMQKIAKMPRWIEWGKKIHNDIKNCEKDIVIKGRHC